MNNSSKMHILYRFNKLIHNQSNLFFLKLIRSNMLKQLSTIYLFHNNIHILISLIRFPHLDNIGMWYQLNYLNLFPQKLTFPFTQGCLINLLNCNSLLSFFILALKNCRKLAISQFSQFIIFIVKTQIASI